MSAIPEAVIRQALHSFSMVPTGPGMRNVKGDHVVVAAIRVLPYALPVEPRDDLAEADIDAAIDEARALVRAEERAALIWLTGPDHPWLADALAERGLRSVDSPGFEAVENAMALMHAPSAGTADSVEVQEVGSFEQFAGADRVRTVAFGIPADVRPEREAELHDRFDDYLAGRSRFSEWIARRGDRVVGAAGGVLGAAAVNLVGGAVLPAERGQGIYRALVAARWDAAVARGTPALTVQAGRMSRPVLERLGFQFIAEMQVYLDEL